MAIAAIILIIFGVAVYGAWLTVLFTRFLINLVWLPIAWLYEVAPKVTTVILLALVVAWGILMFNGINWDSFAG